MPSGGTAKRPLSKRTQLEMLQWVYNILKGEGKGMSEIRLQGVFEGGYPVELRLDLPEVVDLTFVSYLRETVSFFGIRPPAGPGPAMSAPAEAPARPAGQQPPQQARPAAPPAPAPAPEPAAGGGQGCPVHGLEFARPGYKGQGWECGAYTESQRSWTRERPYVLRSGEQRWYCASRWS